MHINLRSLLDYYILYGLNTYTCLRLQVAQSNNHWMRIALYQIAWLPVIVKVIVNHHQPDRWQILQVHHTLRQPVELDSGCCSEKKQKTFNITGNKHVKYFSLHVFAVQCHGLTLLNIKSEDTMACCAQQIMYRMTKGIRFLL